MDEIFLASGFEEDVVYTPSGGAAKTIKAMVLRGGTDQTQQGGTGQTRGTANRKYDLEILVSTNATTGVAQVTPRVDTVSIAQRTGETAKTFVVQGVVYSDEGAWRLGLG